MVVQDSSVTARIYDLTGKQIRMIELGHTPARNYVESSKAIYWDGRSENGEYVSKLRLKYKVDVMIQRVIILFLLMLVILAGCKDGAGKISSRDKVGVVAELASQQDALLVMW